MADNSLTILQVSGWTAGEIKHLVENLECPDHWIANPVPTYALLESIRAYIDSSEKSYRQGFPPVLDILGCKQPKQLVSLISKIGRYVKKAEASGDFLSLCQRCVGLHRSDSEVIGPACNIAKITPDWLQKDDVTFPDQVTNKIVVELQQYRARKGVSWNVVAATWWPKLFPGTTPPVVGTIITSWNSLAARKIEVSRNSTTNEREDFFNGTYVLPVPSAPKTIAEVDSPSDDEQSESDSDSGYDTTNDDVRQVHTMLRSHGDTVALLHDLLETERKEKQQIQQALEQESELRKRAEASVCDANDSLKQCMKEKFNISQEYKNECSRYERQLRKSRDLSLSLEAKVRHLSNSNVNRRLQTKNSQVLKLQSENERLRKMINDLQQEINQLHDDKVRKRREIKNKGEQLRYHKVRRGEERGLMKEQNDNLKEQLAVLERENDQLHSDLDEIMGNKEITTFEDGKYKSDIRVVCYELISRGVSSRNVSDIIRLVLKKVGGFDCGKLPKPTLIRLMALEQALLAKDSARHSISSCPEAITLQLDGTSKKHVPYVTMLASTTDGTYGIGLTEVQSETAETLLKETMLAVEELLAINDHSANEDKVNELLLKIKNTMTDRCIVNKKMVQLLQEWRDKTLPKITAQWDSLSAKVKAQMTTINDLYCGKHLVLNMQEYAAAALNDWETVESGGNKIGREKHLLWNRKESATILAIRTVCEAFGPDANAQAGSPIEFTDYLSQNGSRSKLKAYRGNRFNIPFENASAVYFHFHKGHIESVCKSLPIHKQNNQLSRSVIYDLEDNIIIGGIRAMGIVNSHITLPIMRMLDTPDISVMDTSKYYTYLHDSVRKWMLDPRELLDDSAILFQDFPPLKGEEHTALYAQVDDEVEFNTRQAISIILHNLYVCIVRQLEDHLPGGKFHKPGKALRKETKSCPKDNVAAERVFAGLDYLKRKSPNISSLAMQGVLLWSQNKTMHYLDSRPGREREELISKAVFNKKHILKAYQEKVKSIKGQRLQEVKERMQAREEKERQLVAQTITNTESALALCGFLCKTAQDVDRLVTDTEPSKLQESLIAQIKYYKSVNRGVVKGSLFFLSSGGVPFCNEALAKRLKDIVLAINIPKPDELGQSTSESSNIKDEQRRLLKEKLLSKLSSRKRKCPFPTDIVSKRIRHTCLAPSGNSLVTYNGKVLRQSTAKDIEELMEDEYKSYYHAGYDFYTVIYDPPYNQLFIYPLKKEWDDNLLEFV